MLLEEIGDELTLRDGKAMIGAIPLDLDAQQLCGGPEISQLEVLGELFNN